MVELIKPEKLGIIVCRNPHFEEPADKKVIYLFVNGEMYEYPPWDFVISLMIDRVIAVSYGLCGECRKAEQKK